VITSVKKSGGSYRTRYTDDVPVIGWREWLAIPTLHVDRIKAKIDTGARTSSIHAFDVQSFTERGAPHVSFSVCPEQHRRHPEVSCVAEILDERLVKSSTGHLQHRYVIEVEIDLGGLIWPIELTLAKRDSMGFRMLIGREAVRNRFLIDSNRSFLSSRCYADVTTIFLRESRKI
jgi:hypothetical protein